MGILDGYRLPDKECEPVNAKRLLLVSALPTAVRRTTRETSLARNRLVIELAAEMLAPYVRTGSQFAAMLNDASANNTNCCRGFADAC